MSPYDHNSVLLALLVLLAGFDTVDNNVLMNGFAKRDCVDGLALKWFYSDLSDRSQCVSINCVYSKEAKFKCGVPQGSGPCVVHNIYVSTGGYSEARKCRCYVDDQ